MTAKTLNDYNVHGDGFFFFITMTTMTTTTTINNDMMCLHFTTIVIHSLWGLPNHSEYTCFRSVTKQTQ